MDFTIPDELESMRKMAYDFAVKNVKPTMEEDEKEHKYRPEIMKKMGDQGMFGCLAPEKFGGLELEYGHMAATLMAIEVARISPSWGLPFNLQMNGPQNVLLKFGSEELKEQFLPGLIAGTSGGCFAITEANSGSDVASMKTTATEVDDGFILNGSKTWISGVPYCGCGVVYAMTDKAAKHKGMSAFFIDFNTPGITQRAITTKLGLHCAPTGEIFFEEAKIPKSALVGKLGQGFNICMQMLNFTRLSSAARAVGVAEACIEEAVKYANEREQFGQPIGQFQMVQEQIGRMSVEHHAAKLLVYRAAWQKDQGMNNTLETSMAKYYAAESANFCASEAVKIFGSYGFSSEYAVERYLRDAKSYQIVEGTSNVQKMIIAQFALGYRK
ncbi:acyl-CoA dehydrogenase family protein [Syntrophorhabdus aromaticivorans]|uniref:Acyl-CoA dehydrogenase n=1 Tax=Syntrophorhabdus aromaticivorans TaxID=328301 RepID=A0A971S006_9BACT|nr:acyl-CoA dehydrogenase family protein [Syntrophorhabdus aromaticivorans]NLW34576.1 acyl-CoA dehydrogenase [Syntrophorhabdus aromaticivorans]